MSQSLYVSPVPKFPLPLQKPHLFTLEIGHPLHPKVNSALVSAYITFHVGCELSFGVRLFFHHFKFLIRLLPGNYTSFD